MTVQIRNLARRYGAAAALAGIDLDIADGEFLALLGPSGAGKTTLLRLIAGLDRPDAGSVFIDGQDVLRLSPRARRIGFVFQNYALFRHMNVARNIAFGLSVKPRRERPARAQVAARVEELLDLMQLSGLGARFPAQLSGGQRQRVALARALAIEPQVLLLDEPFGALDAQVRGELREWLRGLQRRLGVTTIFVTHDQQEAFQLADRIAVLNAGRLEQVGSPAAIRAHPAGAFVRAFVGAGDHTAPSAERLDDACRCSARGDAVAPPALIPVQPPAPLPAARQEEIMMLQPGATPADIAVIDRPAWTPRTVRVVPVPETGGDDLPAVAAGELWLIALADANAALPAPERAALTRANVIIYDRRLADVVAAVMPLGGYAEPTDGDGLTRSLQFIRDGWSVVRLVVRRSSEDDGDGRFDLLAQRLREAGAFPGWRLRRLSARGGRWLPVDDRGLGGAAEPPPACGAMTTREVIVVSASGGAAPRLRAVAANGLAG